MQPVALCSLIGVSAAPDGADANLPPVAEPDASLSERLRACPAAPNVRDGKSNRQDEPTAGWKVGGTSPAIRYGYASQATGTYR